MERPKDLMLSARNSIVLVILFHLTGLAGLLVPAVRPFFLHLVPFHLWIMAVIIITNHRPINKAFLSFFGLTIIVCFLIEWTGVHTAWLFGSYIYGNTLGLKFFDIPVIISINWFLLIYCTGVAFQYSRIKSIWIRVFTGALILVVLDIMIEPAAMRYDYWHWATNTVPFKNYICWFIISACLLFVFEKFKFDKQNKVGQVLLIAQFLFFAFLLVRNGF